jgi:hypothetical protein
MLNQPKNHLLGFLRSRPRAVGDAFRTNPRHRSRRRARLAWQAADKSRTTAARLVDISRMGAALTTDNPPTVSTLVRLRLVGSTPTPWIEANVVGVEPTDGTYRVRLKFRDPCPTIMLKAAVLGVVTSAHESSAAESTEHD